MAGCKTDIDWASKPEPWCWVGPQFRREIDGLAPARSSFGKKMLEARKALGLTQADIAKLAGYPGGTGHISSIERDEVQAVGERRQRLIEVLGIDE